MNNDITISLDYSNLYQDKEGNKYTYTLEFAASILEYMKTYKFNIFDCFINYYYVLFATFKDL